MPAAVRLLTFLAFVSSSVVMFEPAPTDLLFIALLFVLVVAGAQIARYEGSGQIVFLGLAAFVAGNVASMAFTHSVVDTVRYFGITALLLGVFVTVAGLIGRFGPDFARMCLYAYCLAALVASVIGILTRFHLLPHADMFFLDDHNLRIRSTFKDSNVFAPFVVAALVVVMNDFVMRRRSLLSAVLYAILYLVAVLFAFSRGAFLNLGVAVLVYAASLLALVRSPRASRRLMGGLFVGGAVAVGALIAALVLSDMSQFFDERLGMQDYDQRRFATQATVLQEALEHPLGIGPGESALRHGMDPHNVYVRILAENGLLGLLGFLAWVGGCMLKGVGGILRRSPEAPLYAAAVAVVAGNLVESLVVDTLHWRHLFVFLAIPVGLAIFESSERRARGTARPGFNGRLPYQA